MTKTFYVPTNHVCMDYMPFHVDYTAGQPYVGSTVSMYPAPGSPRGEGRDLRSHRSGMRAAYIIDLLGMKGSIRDPGNTTLQII
jgi:glucose dehydrogenase